MPDEHKPVMCPWCGWDMVAREWQDVFHGKYHLYVCEGCEATSPIAYSEDSAYLAATRTPPNKPLTQDEARALDPHTPIYAQFRDGDVITGPYAIGDALPLGEWPEYGKTVRWWTAWPDEELRKATGWEAKYNEHRSRVRMGE